MVAPHSKFGAIRTSRTDLPAFTNCEICEMQPNPSAICQACANCTKFSEWCHHGDFLRGANLQFDRIICIVDIVDNKLLLDQN